MEKIKLGEGGFGTVSRARDKATGARREKRIGKRKHGETDKNHAKTVVFKRFPSVFTFFSRRFMAFSGAFKCRRAVKIILKAHIQDPEFLEREIEITRKLDHPNIVRLFAVYEARRRIGDGIMMNS